LGEEGRAAGEERGESMGTGIMKYCAFQWRKRGEKSEGVS